MYILTLHPNKLLFCLALIVGLAATLYFPPMFADKVVEVPLAALYLAEVGLALLAALLFYENATISQVVQLAAWVLGFSMAFGAAGNFTGRSTQLLPDAFVLINWVQLAIMNASGMLSTLCLFRIEPLFGVKPQKAERAKQAPAETPKPAAKASPAAPNTPAVLDDFSPPPELRAEPTASSTPATQPPESVKEILEGLDISRINRLERSLRPRELSLESLFKEESQAAEKVRGWGAQVAPHLPEPAPDAGPVAGQGQDDSANIAMPAGACGAPLITQTEPSPEVESPLSAEATGDLAELQPDSGAAPVEVAAIAAVPPPKTADPEAVALEVQRQAVLACQEEASLAPAEPDTGAASPPWQAAIEVTAGREVAPPGPFAEAETPTSQEAVPAAPPGQPLAGQARPPSLAVPLGQDEARPLHKTMRNMPIPGTAPVKDQAPPGKEKPASREESFEERIVREAAERLKDDLARGAVAQLAGAQSSAPAAEPAGESMSIFQKLLQSQPCDALLKPEEPIAAPSAVPSSKKKCPPTKTAPGGVADGEIEDIFRNLVPDSAQKTVGGKTGPPAQQDEVLFDKTAVDQEVDDIFKRLVPDSPPRTVGEKAPPPTKQGEGLFEQTVVNEEVDDIFKRLVPASAQREVSAEILRQLRADVGPTPDPAGEPAGAGQACAPAQQARGPVTCDQALELISSLAGEPAAAPPPAHSAPEAPPREPGQPQVSVPASVAKEVKEFGRLAPATPAQEPESAGTMKTIGKMLIDVQAVENIIKSAQSGIEGTTTARIVSVKKGEDIRVLLGKIDRQPGVEGSILIGHDGLVISSTMPEDTDKDALGALCLAVEKSTALAAEKLGLAKMRQAVLHSPGKLTILNDVPAGVLAVFVARAAAPGLNELMEKIVNITHDEFPELPVSEFQAAVAEPEAAAAALEPALGATPALPPQEPGAKTPETEKAAEKAAFSAEPEQTSAVPGEAAKTSGAAKLLFELAAGEEQPNTLAPPAPASAVAADLVRDLIASLAGAPAEPAQKPAEQAPAERPPVEEAQPAAAAEAEMESLTGAAATITQPVPVSREQLEAARSADEAATQAGAATEKPTEEAPAGAAATPQPAPATARERERAAAPEWAPAKEIKEFGRLSAKSKAADVQPEQGTMKTIGKMLIDAQAVANIIKAGEIRPGGLTTARVISAARGEGIRSLLAKIDSYPGVAGSLIVGHDGLVIASTLGSGWDRDMYGALSSSIHSNTNLATEKLELGALGQTILQSEDKVTILTEVEVGVLAVFCEQRQPDKLNGLLAAIEATVHG